MRRFGGVAKIHTGIDSVLISAAVLFDGYISAFFQVGDDCSDRSFGNSNYIDQITNAQRWVFTQGYEDMPVVGEQGPLLTGHEVIIRHILTGN